MYIEKSIAIHGKYVALKVARISTVHEYSINKKMYRRIQSVSFALAHSPKFRYKRS